ncbi:MAG: sensor histidine kinase [Halolamina sp.]
MTLRWIGSHDPPESVVRLADRRGWPLVTAASVAAAVDAVASDPPAAILLGVDDADLAQLRRAAPGTPIGYCPPTTTPDGVAAATAAGVDLVLPQDATVWGVDALDERLIGSAADTTDVDDTAIPREHEHVWTLFENFPDPVVDTEHVDGGPVIRAANDAFLDVFGCARDAIVDEQIDDVLGARPRGAREGIPPEAINEQVRAGEVTTANVRRETPRGVRTFLFRGIPYAENGSVRSFGIYTDVTDIERRERHVKVLDRLLRHNLRNDLGIVIGRAENVRDRSTDPEIQAEAAGLVDAAAGLIDLSETAKRIRRIIEEPIDDRTAIPVSELFAAVAADAREQYPGATIRIDAPPDLTVLATSDLHLALQELVENAIVHGADPPTVELAAEPFAGAPAEWVDLLVVDDGPGIPEPERAAVTGDQAITQLQHGSGLGLWLVRWAVESVGGDLSFERRDGWTVARLQLRRTE